MSTDGTGENTPKMRDLIHLARVDKDAAWPQIVRKLGVFARSRAAGQVACRMHQADPSDVIQLALVDLHNHVQQLPPGENLTTTRCERLVGVIIQRRAVDIGRRHKPHTSLDDLCAAGHEPGDRGRTADDEVAELEETEREETRRALLADGWPEWCRQFIPTLPAKGHLRMIAELHLVERLGPTQIWERVVRVAAIDPEVRAPRLRTVQDSVQKKIWPLYVSFVRRVLGDRS